MSSSDTQGRDMAQFLWLQSHQCHVRFRPALHPGLIMGQGAECPESGEQLPCPPGMPCRWDAADGGDGGERMSWGSSWVYKLGNRPCGKRGRS